MYRETGGRDRGTWRGFLQRLVPGPLVLAGPVEGTGSFSLFTSCCYNYCCVSLHVVCQDQISFITPAALDLVIPLFPLPDGWGCRDAWPHQTSREELLTQREKEKIPTHGSHQTHQHSRAPLLHVFCMPRTFAL